jgi:hypothetical protein
LTENPYYRLLKLTQSLGQPCEFYLSNGQIPPALHTLFLGHRHWNRRPRYRVISDCHFTAQLNHFRPGFLSCSVDVFLKRQSDITLPRYRPALGAPADPRLPLFHLGDWPPAQPGGDAADTEATPAEAGAAAGAVDAGRQASTSVASALAARDVQMAGAMRDAQLAAATRSDGPPVRRTLGHCKETGHRTACTHRRKSDSMDSII